MKVRAIQPQFVARTRLNANGHGAGLRSVALPAVSALMTCLGCASKGPPLDAWQQKITTYVTRQGHGDPNCLRDLVDLTSRRSVRPASITFAATENARSRDARGVLVGQQQVGSQPWYFFLVGVMENHPRRGSRLEEIHALAFTPASDGLHWATGRAERNATETYLEADRSWRFRDRLQGGWNQPFPGHNDIFAVSVSGREVTLTEQRSGASWRIEIPPGSAPDVTTLAAGPGP